MEPHTEEAFFWLGKNTYKVPFKMHRENRLQLLSKLKDPKFSEGTVFLLEGGKSKMRYDSDHELLFRQESFFQYLFGVKEPDVYGLIDLASKKSYLFIQKLPIEYAIWMGKILTPEDFKRMYEVDEVRYVDELPHVLKQELNCHLIYTLEGGINTDSKRKHKGATFSGIEEFRVDKTAIFPELVECRVHKSPEELKLLKYVNKISSEAHIKVMEMVYPGMKEFEIESTFYHHVYTHGGCRNLSYTCICASGHNGSTLHYGHAGAPNDKTILDGELVLCDMGAEYHCYCSDITRTFPVNGKFTENQKIIYEIVLDAQQAVIDHIKPGVTWPDMHRLAQRIICTGLAKHGFLKGDIEELINNKVPALFMPHGLGHFLGLDTHDVGGFAMGLERIQDDLSIKCLRTVRVLEENMVLTVEPGIYFIDALLEPALNDPVLSRYLVSDKIREFMKFGGVRLEDNIIVTKDGCENLTTVPKSIAEIEDIMARGKKQ
eukprot:TRINITY_DN8360_c0_g1_i2.p1 TRINITY_DN8360_c0_g1~~TRINITY_DN8360_c0_g1_i2.p1  ORF type:complete len:533 (+),score=101.03 TRINITY_DN8360_c0_g1_i2:133-1599(+)